MKLSNQSQSLKSYNDFLQFGMFLDQTLCCIFNVDLSCLVTLHEDALPAVTAKSMKFVREDACCVKRGYLTSCQK